MSSRDDADVAHQTARTDLIAGSQLLSLLSSLIRVRAADEKASGVVVAAPHHAQTLTPLSGGHDVETGPIARDLAHALGGRCVVANELRTFVDLNKSPHEQQTVVKHLGRLSFRDADQTLKLYYQSQVFAENPSTVIEIHGHVRGLYDLEVSVGCMLDDRISQDHTLLAALRDFKSVLVEALRDAPAFREAPPTVGVFPLALDVKFAATGTHTFNKIERLRELGVNVAGLHIELGRKLRLERLVDENSTPYGPLVDCLASAVRAFMERNRAPFAFDTREPLLDEFLPDKKDVSLLRERGLVLRSLPKELVGRQVAAFGTDDIERLGLAIGQSVLLAPDAGIRRTVELRVEASDRIARGSVGVSKAVRSQLGRQCDELVYAANRPAGATDGLVLAYVGAVSDQITDDALHVSDVIAGELQRFPPGGGEVAVRSWAGKSREATIVPTADLAHPRAVGMSKATARHLETTFGDIICLIPMPPRLPLETPEA